MDDKYKEKYETLQQKMIEDALKHFDKRLQKMEEEQQKLVTIKNKLLGIAIVAPFFSVPVFEVLKAVLIK